MATYEFRCSKHGSMEAFGVMSSPPKGIPCKTCGKFSPRRFTPPQFTEDKTRFYRAPDGSKFNPVTGTAMPDSGKEYYKQLESIGAEPVSPKTMPEPWKDNVAYQQHVSHGGERDARFEKAPHPATSQGSVTVRDQLRRSGIRFG